MDSHILDSLSSQFDPIQSQDSINTQTGRVFQYLVAHWMQLHGQHDKVELERSPHPGSSAPQCAVAQMPLKLEIGSSHIGHRRTSSLARFQSWRQADPVQVAR